MIQKDFGIKSQALLCIFIFLDVYQNLYTWLESQFSRYDFVGFF